MGVASKPPYLYIASLGNIQDEVHVSIVVVVRPARDGYNAVRESNELCIGCHVFRRDHGEEFDGPFVVEDLVGPASYGPYALDCCYSIVTHEDAFDDSSTFKPTDEFLGGGNLKRSRRKNKLQ